MGNEKLHKQSFQKEEVTEAQQLSMVRTEQRPDTLRQRASRSHLVAFLIKKNVLTWPSRMLGMPPLLGHKGNQGREFQLHARMLTFRCCMFQDASTSFVAGVRDPTGACPCHLPISILYHCLQTLGAMGHKPKNL